MNDPVRKLLPNTVIRRCMALTCGMLIAVSVWIATPMRAGSLDLGDKTPLVESGYIYKIDLKKKSLTVRGSVVVPSGPAQNFSSVQSPGGSRGGGRGGGNPDEANREFNVYVHPDTVIQNETRSLTIEDLRVQDYVVVLGKPKGKSTVNVNATSISVSNR